MEHIASPHADTPATTDAVARERIEQAYARVCGDRLATPAGHARPTCRNFCPPAARWRLAGLRLARELA